MNQWRKGSEIYWICSGQPVSCRLIARKLSAPQTSTACRSPETVCRIYCISPFWLPCNSNFIYKRVHKNIYLYIIHRELTELILETRKHFAHLNNNFTSLYITDFFYNLPSIANFIYKHHVVSLSYSYSRRIRWKRQTFDSITFTTSLLHQKKKKILNKLLLFGKYFNIAT